MTARRRPLSRQLVRATTPDPCRSVARGYIAPVSVPVVTRPSPLYSVMRLCPDPPPLIRTPVVGSKDPACSSVTLSNPRYTSKDPVSKQGHCHRLPGGLKLGKGPRFVPGQPPTLKP